MIHAGFRPHPLHSMFIPATKVNCPNEYCFCGKGCRRNDVTKWDFFARDAWTRIFMDNGKDISTSLLCVSEAVVRQQMTKNSIFRAERTNNHPEADEESTLIQWMISVLYNQNGGLTCPLVASSIKDGIEKQVTTESGVDSSDERLDNTSMVDDTYVKALSSSS